MHWTDARLCTSMALAQAVAAVLNALGQEGSQEVPCPSWHYQEQQASAAGVQSKQMQLQGALTKCYDLRCVPG